MNTEMYEYFPIKDFQESYRALQKSRSDYDKQREMIENRVKTIFTKFDDDSNQSITVGEFMRDLLKINPSLKMSDVKKAFTQFESVDKNKSQNVTLTEVMNYVYQFANIPPGPPPRHKNISENDEKVKFCMDIQSQRIHYLEDKILKMKNEHQRTENGQDSLIKTQDRTIEKLNETILELKSKVSKGSLKLKELESELKTKKQLLETLDEENDVLKAQLSEFNATPDATKTEASKHKVQELMAQLSSKLKDIELLEYENERIQNDLNSKFNSEQSRLNEIIAELKTQSTTVTTLENENKRLLEQIRTLQPNSTVAGYKTNDTCVVS